MRTYRMMAVGLAGVLGLTGCSAMRDREWGPCAVAGGLVGAALGGVGGGLGVSEVENGPTNGERAAGAGAGFVGGGLIGALLGHMICDPEKKMPPPPPVAQVPPAPRRLVTLHGPQFDFDKSALKPEGKRMVDTAVKAMRDDPNMRVSVEGHTDSVGSDAYNQRLSERRANVVRDYMVEQGIAASRITAVGFGESKPVASNETAAGRAENRRVDIDVKQ
jgi:OOP family OmpA-OmpF porin